MSQTGPRQTGVGSSGVLSYGTTLSSRCSYESAQKHFLLFCQDANFSPTSVSEELLCGYVAFLSKEGLKHTSIKSYLSAVRYMEITLGLPDPFAVSMPCLEQVLKGIKVWQGRQGQNKPNQKLPISPEILQQMKSLWLPHERDLTFTMLWAACCICFCFFWGFSVQENTQCHRNSDTELLRNDECQE